MLIHCPNCERSYQLAPAAVGASGRSVRCVRCHNVWFVPPAGFVPPTVSPPKAAPAAQPTDPAVAAFGAELGTQPQAAADAAAPGADKPTESPAAPEHAAPPADAAAEAPDDQPPVALADIPIPLENAPPLVPAPGEGARPIKNAASDGSADIETVAARRSRKAGKRRRGRRIPPSLIIVALGALAAGLLGLRREVVHYAPQMASFYSAIGLPVNLRGLAFTDLKIGNEFHDGVPILVVEGVIVSMTSKTADLPRLRFALRNPSGAEIYAWTAPPSQPTLGPFEALPFRSRLASPPAEGHDVQVRFFTRRDAVASR
jgi:predicted Zn finger-like uncharacterized protein